MKKNTAKTASKADTEDLPQLRFYGAPGIMRAYLQVEPAESKRRKMDVRFVETDLNDSGKRSLSGASFQHRVSRNRQQVAIRIPLSPNTPPGTYRTVIEADGQQYNAEFEITETISASITPQGIYLEGAPGSSVTKIFFVTNNGNVPLEFKDPGAVMLEDEFIECKVIRGAVRNLRSGKELKDVIDTIAQELESTYQEAGAMRVRVAQKEPIVIIPGATAKVPLNFTFPANLRSSTRYLGGIRFYNAGVNLTVMATGGKE